MASHNNNNQAALPSSRPAPPPKRLQSTQVVENNKDTTTSIVDLKLPTSKPLPPKKVNNDAIELSQKSSIVDSNNVPPLPPRLPSSKPAPPPPSNRKLPISTDKDYGYVPENSPTNSGDEENEASMLSTKNPIKKDTTGPIIYSTNSNPFMQSSSTQNPFDQDVQEVSIAKVNKIDYSNKNSTIQLNQMPSSSNQSIESSSTHDNNSFTPILYGLKNKGDPSNMIYSLTRYSVTWMLLFLVLHCGQFILLLNVGYDALPDGAFGVVTVLVCIVVILVIASRLLVTKSHLSNRRNISYNNNQCTPEDEADVVPDSAIYCLTWAALLEGLAFAIYTAVSSGHNQSLNDYGFYTKNTLLQVLRFASITLLALHRIIRPANRLDPMRTILELEVVAVCWDALDGSTLYELMEDTSDISGSTKTAIRVVMVAWYFTVGVRMALMYLTQLSPTSKVQATVVTAPFQLAPQPTVDRTLQGIRIRSIITLTMAAADLYAGGLRIVLWNENKLDALQQDMCIKNMMFLSAIQSAYYNYKNSVLKIWNAREIINYPCIVRYPRRIVQIELFRYFYAFSHLLITGLMTVILVHTTDDSNAWIGNMIIDVLLVLIFLIYARNAHVHDPTHTPTSFFIPHKSFFKFPGYMAVIMGSLLAISGWFFRLPALYFHYSSMNTDDSTELWTYNNSMLLIAVSSVPLAAYSCFWSISYMIFRKEFTASPGNYNSIHDPTINIVNMATMIEGALDILSASTLMQLASSDLPDNVNNAIVLFCLLEIVNGCQSFALPCLLSGGHDDTPKDLIRWNAYLRVSRGFIDFGTIILRVVLWVQYNAVSSVFLVKNLYSLIHTITQVDRWNGVGYYPPGTLFSEYVPSEEWYGMTFEQFRIAILSGSVRKMAQRSIL